MTTTLSTLRTLVIDKLGLTTNDGRMTSASLNRSINTGLQKLATDYDWPWLVVDTTLTTAAGDDSYSPPSGWTRTKRLSYENDLLTERQRDDFVLWNEVENVPHLYAVEGTTIYLCPTPNNTYSLTHTYITAETVLSGDSDTPLCPDYYIDVVVTYAALDMARKIKDTSLLNTLEQERKDWLKRIRDNVQRTYKSPQISTREDW